MAHMLQASRPLEASHKILTCDCPLKGDKDLKVECLLLGSYGCFSLLWLCLGNNAGEWGTAMCVTHCPVSRGRHWEVWETKSHWLYFTITTYFTLLKKI